jgi:DNA-binding NarL/FixJ family response regulator
VANQAHGPPGADQPARRLRVVLVEDEDLFRNLLGVSLGLESDLEVVGSFGDAASALAVAPALQPDVVLLDVELGGGQDGITLGLELRRRLPALGIVVLSQHTDARFLSPLPRAAVTGWSYLLKRSVRDPTVLARAIRGCAAGYVVLDPWLADRQRPKPDSPLARLAPRHREILGLVAQGLTNSAIAERLTITEKSVENALTITYEQLGLDRHDGARHLRVQAVLAYLRDGTLSEPGEPARRASSADAGRDGARTGAPPMTGVSASSSPARYSILLVDDQPAFLDAARTLLGADGRLAVVGAAASGPLALEAIQQQAPDAVLLDIQMPGMNGFETAQAVRALAPGTHVVFTSSDEDPVYLATARQLGGGFVPKRRLSAQAVLDLLEQRA